MKQSMLKELDWLDEHQVGDSFVVHQYRAYHKLGRDIENGLAIAEFEGYRVVNVKCPIVIDYEMPDGRFIVEPCAKGLRVPKGCNGFMIWIGWYYDLYPYDCEKFLYSLMTNSKLPTSGLSAYIKDQLSFNESKN